MHRLLVLVVAAFALTLGGFALAVAQQETEEINGAACPSPVASPDASPEATPDASPEATPEASPMATPDASPEATPAGAEDCPTPAAGGEAGEVAVDIRDFAYNPDPVEVPVGGTVTWTNQDSAPHTATGQDRDVLQSGTLNQGESYSQTFNEAGEYEYFCEFHPNMNGTVVVQ